MLFYPLSSPIYKKPGFAQFTIFINKFNSFEANIMVKFNNMGSLMFKNGFQGIRV